jgi:chemotaxis protein CheZ
MTMEITREIAGTRPLNDVLGKVESMLSDCSTPAAVYLELKHLAEFIQDTKTEIAALRPDVVKQQYLPTAADELDAIVAATAQATNAIMDAADSIMAAGESPAITDAVTKIYEACTFQDITGQRITKVVKTLKHIEDRVEALVAAFGDEIQKYREMHPSEQQPQKGADEKLLNGPQLPDEAGKQADIDALLASFD